MNMLTEHQSPFDNLNIEKELVIDYFAVFSRFEHALKVTGYRKRGSYDAVNADWTRFSGDACPWFNAIPEALNDAVNYLLQHPPYQQVIKQGALDWKLRTFKEEDTVATRVLEAVKTVRNNLFHGGKHMPHSPPGRDERLIKACLEVLYYCLDCSEQVRIEYTGGY